MTSLLYKILPSITFNYFRIQTNLYFVTHNALAKRQRADIRSYIPLYFEPGKYIQPILLEFAVTTRDCSSN